MSFDASEVADIMSDCPNTWSDGSKVQDPISGHEITGAGVFSSSWERAGDTRAWRLLDCIYIYIYTLSGVGRVNGEDCSRVFSSILGSLQSVQLAEFWTVILALQAFIPVILGVDLLNVFKCVAKPSDGSAWSQLSPLHKDEDLISYIHGILDKRGRDTVREAKVKGHDTDDMVSSGQARQEDEDGNEAADEVADLDRWRRQEHYGCQQENATCL